MGSTVLQIKQQMASYMGKQAVADLNPSTDMGGINIDLGLYALNTARRKFERAHDFKYAEINGALSITASGGLITAATGLGAGATIKRVVDVELPIAGGDYIPIEFMTEDAWTARVRRQVGRQAYDPLATLASLGVSDENPIAYQQGQTIFLAPAAQFTFPVAARLNVVRFMADYTTDADQDFFCDYAPDALLWSGLLELNKLFRRYAPKQEGNISDEEIVAFAAESTQALMKWDTETVRGTSTPGGDQ